MLWTITISAIWSGEWEWGYLGGGGTPQLITPQYQCFPRRAMRLIENGARSKVLTDYYHKLKIIVALF